MLVHQRVFEIESSLSLQRSSRSSECRVGWVGRSTSAEAEARPAYGLGRTTPIFGATFGPKKHWNLPKLMRSESMTSGSLAVSHCIDHLYLYLQWWCVWTHSLPRDTNRSNGRQSSKLLRRCVLFPLIFFSHGLKSTSAAPVLSRDFPENVGI